MIPTSAKVRASNPSIPWAVFIALVTLPGSGMIDIWLQYHTLVPLLVILAISLFTYYLYWLDKRRAQRNEWRIPEANLHLLALAGGWPGAFVAQYQFRHKTKKVAFLWVFWLIVLSHQMLWFDWLFMDSKWLVLGYETIIARA